jgi:3-hydroxyacyl-CoA dehydrogenase
MVSAGLLGNKTGAGFYLWADNKPQQVNGQLLKYLKQ